MAKGITLGVLTNVCDTRSNSPKHTHTHTRNYHIYHQGHSLMLGTIDSPLWHTLVPSRRRANWPLTHCDAGRGVAYSLALAPNAVRVRVRAWGYGEEVIKSADAEKCGWGGTIYLCLPSAYLALYLSHSTPMAT